MADILQTPDTATGTKLAAPITDKKGYGQRWHFSVRHVDNLLAEGMPHLKIGARRVRIITAEADAWMWQRYGTQRRGPAKRKQQQPSHGRAEEAT
jgi:hypothetical protein